MPRMRRKAELPQKPCLRCGRPFAWRKAWARDWDAVRWCSERCRRGGGPAGGSTRKHPAR